MNIETFTLEQKVGQLFLLGYSDLKVTGDLINLLTKNHVSGIVYSGTQRFRPKTFSNFSNNIQKYSQTETPFFIAIKEESIQSIDEITPIPNKLALGALDNRLYSKKTAEITGQQLRNLGFNMILSPNLNLEKNKVTDEYTLFPFGENIKKVKKHATDMMTGYENSYVIPVTNCFPTMDIDGQAHPVSEQSLQPFMYAVKRGIDLLMVSNTLKSSISPQVIQRGLRKEVGYEGIIVTDNIEQLGENNGYTIQEATVSALKAGVDLIYLNSSLEKQQAAIHAVIKAVKYGELEEANIDESFRKIIHLKRKYKLSELPTFDRDLIGKSKDIKLVKKINEQSITIIKNDEQLLPLNKGKKSIILTPKTSSISTSASLNSFSNFFHGELEDFTEEHLDTNDDTLNLCAEAEQIIIPINQLEEDNGDLLAIQEIISQYGNKTVISSFGKPFDLLELASVSTLTATYELSLISMQATAKVLLNDRRTRSKLPLTLSEQWPIGYQAK